MPLLDWELGREIQNSTPRQRQWAWSLSSSEAEDDMGFLAVVVERGADRQY